MPRRDLYEASLERCDYDNRFRLRFVSDWARFSRYLELDGRALRGVERELVDLYRHTYGRAVDGLFAAGLTPEEANETLHRISARLDDEGARALEYYRIAHDRPRRVPNYLPDLICIDPARHADVMTMAILMREQNLRMHEAMLIPREPHPEACTKTALEKSMQLLIRNLAPAQRQEFERNHHFTVKVRDLTFRINSRPTFNVTDLATGVRYCTRSAEPVPIYDLMLAQKLMLEVNPDSFFAVANDDMATLLPPELTPPPPNIRIEPRQEIRDQHRPRGGRDWFAPW